MTNRMHRSSLRFSWGPMQKGKKLSEYVAHILTPIRRVVNQYLKNQQRLNREIATWRSLHHPNIAELLGIARLNPGQPPGLVSQYVQRHDFLAYIGRHPELKRRKVFINLSFFVLDIVAQFIPKGSRNSLRLRILTQ
jgi:serine/threonine protein kinase